MFQDEENIDPALVKLRHDINNQLSNIQLCLEELKHELGNSSDDCRFYLDKFSAELLSVKTPAAGIL